MTPQWDFDFRELLRTAEEEVLSAWEQASQESRSENPTVDSAADTMLDRVAQVGISLVENKQYQDMGSVTDVLIHLFRAAGENRPPILAVVPIADELQAMRWYGLATRVYLLGATCLAQKAFGVMPELVLQQPNPLRNGRFWLRDTVTALARLKRFEKQSLIGPISDYVMERPVFSRRFHSNNDVVVSSLCQFDFLQCVMSVLAADDLHACYPNFGGFFKERTEPVIVDLVTHGKAREAVPNVDDTTLASVILELDKLAGREFFSYAGWIAGDWDDSRVPAFLAEHTRAK